MSKLKYGRGHKKFVSVKPNENGSVTWYVNLQVDPHDDYVEAHVQFRDCSRVITLDFFMCENDSFEERYDKVDVIIDSLEKFKKVMKSVESLTTLMKPFKKEKKKEKDESTN